MVSGSPPRAAADLAGAPGPILGLAGLHSPLWGDSARGRAELAYLDRAFAEGYRIMDTAAIYGLGASERGLGRWMELRRNREQVTVITKGGHPRIWRPAKSRLRVDCIAGDLAASLQRLRTGYIDLYLLHRDDVECDLGAILQYLHTQVSQGTLRAIGVSNWSHERIAAANALAGRLGLTAFSVSSPQLSLLSWTRPPWRGALSISGSQGAAARAWYRDTGLPVLAWSPFGGGVADAAAAGWTPTGACYDSPDNRRRLVRAAAIGRARNLSVPQVLVAYLASAAFPVHPVCASRSIDHLRANRAAVEVTLSADEINLLDSA